MKITDVKVETIHIPMKKPFRIAFAVQDHSVNVLVKITTDEGLWGIGEAAPFEPVTGESTATVLEALKLFRTGLIGMDPLDIEGIHCMMDRLLSGNTSAKAAPMELDWTILPIKPSASTMNTAKSTESTLPSRPRKACRM